MVTMTIYSSVCFDCGASASSTVGKEDADAKLVHNEGCPQSSPDCSPKP